jgi:hypothetical protein
MSKINAYSKSAGIILVLGCTSLLSAQLNSGQQTISITAHTTESIGISITNGSTVNFSLQGGAGSAVPTFTTSWVLASSRTALKVYAYFQGATALTGLNPANTIAATSFSGSADGGVFTNFSSAAVTAVSPGGVGVFVSNTQITSGNLTSSKTDSLGLALNTGSTPFTADTYTGTLVIQAQATP